MSRMRLRLGAALWISLLLGPACAQSRSQSPERTAAIVVPKAPGVECLIVGGGPTRRQNEVAIESNVHYLRKILPPGSVSTTLWADGHPNHANVQYLTDSGDHYRRSTLTDVAGSNGPDDVYKSIELLWKPQERPLLLYFTGHGSPDDTGRENTTYASWGDEDISVGDLRHMLDLPGGKRVTLVMVQCFSGGFGNLIFKSPKTTFAGNQGGAPRPEQPGEDPGQQLVDDATLDDSVAADVRPDFCGFFASLPTREAAGCTDEVDQAYYHDFTSYFFAALSGKDRLGHPVTGTDFSHPGTVGMNDAFAYDLINDISIDTPICTSEVFLRSAVNLPDREIFQTPYSVIRGWATPSQGAVLDALSKRLALSGEDRLGTAYERFQGVVRLSPFDEDDTGAFWIRYVRIVKDAALRHIVLTKGSPALADAFVKIEALESENPLRPAQS